MTWLYKVNSRKKISNLKSALYSVFTPIHKSPLLILGNQKSGTSAISWLLSQMTDLPLTLDVTRSIGTSGWQKEVKSGNLDFIRWCKKYSYELSKPLIKEPALTLFIPELLDVFPNARFVFIVRDPRDNIRSILNRVSIPGDINGWPNLSALGVTNADAWQSIINSDWVTGEKSSNCIESLAYRWNYCVEQYRPYTNRIELVKYEDFRSDKVGFIQQLAKTYSLTCKKDITHLTNRQMQAKGDNSLSWIKYFGEENLQRIDKITETQRGQLGY